MNDFLNKLRQRLAGRNGADAFSAFFIALGAVFVVVSRFPHLKWMRVLALFCVLYALFRMFSSDRSARSAENRRFLETWKKFRDWCALRVKMAKEFKTHRYLRCPGCRATLRVPRVKGTHTVACPHCGNRFETIIR